MGDRRIHFLATPVLAALGRAGGLIIPLLVAFFYGVSAATDAFFVVFRIMLFMSGLFTRIFESLLIPYLAEGQAKSLNLGSFLNGILLICMPFLSGFCLLFLWGLPPVLKMTSGLGPESIHLTTVLFAEMIPFLLLGVLIAAQNSLMNIHKIFWFPAVSPLIRSIIIISCIFALKPCGIHGLAGGYSLGEAVRWGLGLFILLRWTGWRWGIEWQKSLESIERFFRESSLQMLALLAIHLIPIADYWFVSWAPKGSISVFSYADRLFQIPYQLFLSGMLQVFFTYWSQSYYEEPPADFWRKMKKDVRRVAIISACVSLTLWMLREFIVDLIFSGANMNGTQRRAVASLFGWLMIGLTPAFIQLLYLRVAFIMKKSLMYCFQAWLQLAANIILNYFLMQYFGLEGIVISTALVFTATAFWLYIYMGKLEALTEAGKS